MCQSHLWRETAMGRRVVVWRPLAEIFVFPCGRHSTAAPRDGAVVGGAFYGVGGKGSGAMVGEYKKRATRDDLIKPENRNSLIT